MEEGSSCGNLTTPAWSKWSDPDMQSCNLDKTWETLVGEQFLDREVLVTGGLGKLMQDYLVESWLCYRDHECSTSENFMCWVYHERDEAWLPWATNSDLGLYPVSVSASRSLDKHKRISQQKMEERRFKRVPSGPEAQAEFK